ncbi:MAG: hypothetical protein R6X02_21480 [Enhygromyxa sp.]
MAAELPRLRNEGFVGSKRCQSCHPRAYETWHASWHRTMTQKVGVALIYACPRLWWASRP